MQSLVSSIRLRGDSRRSRRHGRWAGPWVGLALCLSAVGVAADEENGNEIETGYERLPSSFHPLGHDFWIMGRLESTFEAEFHPDLGGKPGNQDEVELEPEGILAVAWQPSDWFHVVTRAEFLQKIVFEPFDEGNPDPKLSLTRAYLVAEDLVPGGTLIVGRQNFVDERKWLWEEPLDGGRAIWRQGAFAVDAAVARDDLVQRNMLERRETEGGNYFWASSRFAFTDDDEAALYALYIDDRENLDDDLLFLGLQSHGELIEDVKHWLEAAAVTGEERGRDVLGFGFDVGATWETGLPFEPALTLAVAFGSGDDGEGKDTAFRQTGLQENSAKFSGVASFDYYGLVLNPELSNLLIVTVGGGIRPSKDSSVDLVYHHYRQVRKSDELRDAGLDADPNGKSTHLGNALDLVLGWDATDNLQVKTVGGLFVPGPAFDADHPAYRFGAEVVVRF